MSAFRPLAPHHLRTMFSSAMSEMYRKEVPQYGTLLELVGAVNERARAADGSPERPEPVGAGRIDIERHGAIRLGAPAELAMARRLFAVMGMAPVGYYDLSAAGVPVHSTAFRPVGPQALAQNPFRVFTSLLRLELIDDPSLRRRAEDILSRRRPFSPRCIALIEQAERDGGLGPDSATSFVLEALETFRWRAEATVSAAAYEELKRVHPLVADVVCFSGPHINHLTPRTLDIEACQTAMAERGLSIKALIEGPPQRRCPILLRQTSFKALSEPIAFIEAGGGRVNGFHTARFGEVEQRGIALTPKGRTLYDALLSRALTAAPHGAAPEAASDELARAFCAFPDDEAALEQQGLAYFRYSLSNHAPPRPLDPAADLATLVRQGQLRREPITYEDFLPVSAAGIFRSNLGDGATTEAHGGPDQAGFEAALGQTVLDPFTLYAEEEARSRQACGIGLALPA